MSTETQAADACSRCGAALTPDARFCAQCALPVGDAPTPVAGERKHVTVLFSDLSGFTEISERIDPEETGEIMAGIFARATEIVERYEGRVEKFMGDAVMAVFGDPETHEDDPVRAVRTALELHRVVEELAPALEKRVGARLALHSGINTGVIVTGELNLDRGTVGVVGDTINVASRLMSDAPSGEIWLGPLTAELTAESIAAEVVGEKSFKGKSAPLRVSRVTGLRDRERIMRPTRTRFVGRADELAMLLGAVDDARDGQSASFGVRAEAGGGKTRLFEEFRRQLPSDVYWLEGRAYAYTQRIPYFLLVDLLSRAFGITEDDRPEVVRQKLERNVTQLLGADSSGLRILGKLYDIRFGEHEVGTATYAPRLTDAARSMLSAWAAHGPAVVCLQDLHWADGPSTALFADIMSAPGAPVVCVANYRPGFEFTENGIRRLDLATFSPRQLEELVASMLDDAAPDGLHPFIAARSEGNPFFAEEIVTALIETGRLLADNGSWTLAGSLDDAGIPSTVQGVLAARIDRLDDTRRRILREASVIGREFLYDVVTRITDVPGPPDDALAGLEAADLIREKSRDEYLEYIFKHALTQEVAYEGLLKRERRTLHRRVGEAIESLLAHRVGEYVDTLAYHFHRAGDVDKAVSYAIAAGKRAFGRHALDDAEAHFASGYELLDGHTRTPEQDRLLIELLVEWSEVLLHDLKQRAAGRMLEKYWGLAERLDDPELTTRYRSVMVTPYWADLDFETAETMADEALALARRHGIVRAEAGVLAWASFSLASTGRIDEALDYARRAVELAERHGYPAYTHHWILGFSQVLAGRFDELEAHLLWMDEQGAAGVSRYRPYAACLRTLRDFFLVDHEAGLAHADAGLSVPYEAFEGSYLLGLKTSHLYMLRRYEEAAQNADLHLEYHRERPTEYCESSVRAQAAGAASIRGEPGKGMARYQREEALQARSGQRFMDTFFHVFSAESYVRMATQEVVPPVSVLLRNLGFVFRHAMLAKRHARRCLDYARQQATELRLDGMAPWIAFTAARVALIEKRPVEARRELEACLEGRRAAGFPEPSTPVRDLMERAGTG